MLHVGVLLTACEHPYFAGAVLSAVSCLLQGLPANLQEYSLLWICRLRFLGRHAEKQRIKIIRGVDEPALADIGGVKHACIRVHVLVIRPSAGSHFTDGASAAVQQLPVFLQAIRPRYAQTHADNGDVLPLFRAGFSSSARCFQSCSGISC
ncbi:hypothetical protein D3C71_1290820 [compost metagenome]